MIDHRYDKTIYNNFITLLIYVDDMLNIDYDTKKIIDLKGELSKFFTIKNLSLTKHIVSIRIICDKKNDKF